MNEKGIRENKYIRPMSEMEAQFWNDAPKWFNRRYKKNWVDRIDTRALFNDAGEEVGELVMALIDFVRIRERVIEHRESVANHTAHLIDLVWRYNYTPEEIRAQMKMISDYLTQMQVGSALEPDAPKEPPKRFEADDE